jgi:hypothetical protein
VRLSKKIELVANVAIIVVAVLLGVVLVKDYLLTKKIDDRTDRQSFDSNKLSALNVDWHQSKQTLFVGCF